MLAHRTGVGRPSSGWRGQRAPPGTNPVRHRAPVRRRSHRRLVSPHRSRPPGVPVLRPRFHPCRPRRPRRHPRAGLHSRCLQGGGRRVVSRPSPRHCLPGPVVPSQPPGGRALRRPQPLCIELLRRRVGGHVHQRILPPAAGGNAVLPCPRGNDAPVLGPQAAGRSGGRGERRRPGDHPSVHAPDTRLRRHCLPTPRRLAGHVAWRQPAHGRSEVDTTLAGLRRRSGRRGRRPVGGPAPAPRGQRIRLRWRNRHSTAPAVRRGWTGGRRAVGVLAGSGAGPSRPAGSTHRVRDAVAGRPGRRDLAGRAAPAARGVTRLPPGLAARHRQGDQSPADGARAVDGTSPFPDRRPRCVELAVGSRLRPHPGQPRSRPGRTAYRDQRGGASGRRDWATGQSRRRSRPAVGGHPGGVGRCGGS